MEKKRNPWLVHVKHYQSLHPGMDYQTALKKARPSYSTRHSSSRSIKRGGAKSITQDVLESVASSFQLPSEKEQAKLKKYDKSHNFVDSTLNRMGSQFVNGPGPQKLAAELYKRKVISRAKIPVISDIAKAIGAGRKSANTGVYYRKSGRGPNNA